MAPKPEELRAAVALAEAQAAGEELARRYRVTASERGLEQLRAVHRNAVEEYNAWLQRAVERTPSDAEVWGAWCDRVHALAAKLQGRRHVAGEDCAPFSVALH